MSVPQMTLAYDRPCVLRLSTFPRQTAIAFSFLVLLFGASVGFAQISVLTQHYDNARTGQNTQETVLTPANVNHTQFGKLFTQSLDGQMPAQPLYVPNVFIPALNATHNVVYAVTMHDSVYAFDADNNQGSNASPLWQVSFLNPANGVTSVPLADETCSVGYTEFGIQGTPVIDLFQNAIFMLAMTKENGSYVHRLHALDLGTGQELFGGPVVVSASAVVNGTTYTFIDRYQQQRPGLLLQNGTIYIGFGSPGCNVRTENGWVMAYDELTLQQVGVFDVSPGIQASAVWMSGSGLAGDGAGNIYFSTGDGLFDGPGGTHFGDTVLKLNQGDGVLTLADYFTPYNQLFFQDQDLDLSSGAVQILPQQPDGSNLLIAIDKNGSTYLLNQGGLGGYNPAGNFQIQQELDVPVADEVHGGLTYWNHTVYIAAYETPVMAYALANDQLSLTPTSQTPKSTAHPQGGIVSSNGTQNGIYWYATSPTNKLFAYDATNLATELYNSSQGGKRDVLTPLVHFPMPVVANGKVYINGQSQLAVFGLLTNQSATTTAISSSRNPSTFGQSVSFTASVTSGAGTPTGSVQFNVDGSAFGSAVALVSGSATSGSTTTLAVGAHTVTAVYLGATNYAGSTGTLSGGQVVNSAAINVSVASSLNPSVYGQAVSFTTSVTAASGTPTGTVQFNVDGGAFGSPAALVSGVATSGSIATLSAGTHTVTGVYSGDSNFAGSTGTLSGGEVVSAAATSVSVASSLNPSVYGQSVTFTVTISGQYGLFKGKSGGKKDVSGTVTWSANTGCGVTPVTSGSPGTATCTTTSLPGGTDTVTATYSGDSNHGGGAGSLSGGQIVNLASQTITFTTNAPASAVYGSNFTVAATSSSGLPVAFTSSGACSNAGAIYTMTSGTGSCSVVASQSGNGNYSAATPVNESTTASKANQTITVTVAAPATAVNGSSFTVAAAASSGLPVTFSSQSPTVCSNVGGTYTVIAKTGACAVSITQAGDSNYSAATGIQESTTVVKAITPTVSFTGAPATASYQATFTVTASSTNDTSIPTISSSGPCAVSGNTVNGTTVSALVTMTKGNGTCGLKASWPINTVYAAATANQNVVAERITSVVTWPTPAPITYGTKLSSTQLDATANVPGKFSYSPATGTKPPVPTPPATCDTLTVKFTPTLTGDYTTATASVCLVVNP